MTSQRPTTSTPIATSRSRSTSRASAPRCTRLNSSGSPPQSFLLPDSSSRATFMAHQESISILLVEDNPDDRILIVDALSRARLMNSVHTVEDGIEALEFVRRQGKYENAP